MIYVQNSILFYLMNLFDRLDMILMIIGVIIGKLIRKIGYDFDDYWCDNWFI